VLIQTDLAKLLLRITVSVLLLFHGIHKLIYGIGGVEKLVVSHGLPHFLAYGVYMAELIAPIFILLGLYARLASGVVAVNMLMAIYLAYGFSLTTDKYGGLAWETPLLYLVMALSIVFLGSGKYAVNAK
jgi:putative oxidoreductase